MAARDNDLAAAAQGIRVAQVRATISGIAAPIFALAGCLSSYQFGYVGPSGSTSRCRCRCCSAGNRRMHSPAGAIVGGCFLQFFPT